METVSFLTVLKLQVKVTQHLQVVKILYTLLLFLRLQERHETSLEVKFYEGEIYLKISETI